METAKPDPAPQLFSVLLVEDNPSDVQLFSRFLKSPKLGEASVQLVSSLQQAIAEGVNTSHSVILLDLQLPDTSGMETLFALQRRTDTPIIVLTGYGDEQLGIQAVQNGAQDFLVKSDTNRDLLWKSIRYAVERHKLQAQRKSLERQLLDVVNKEQRRIGSELHDSLGQELTGLGLLAKSLAKKLENAAPEQAGTAETIVSGIQKVLQDVKTIIRGLTPVDMDGRGLEYSLEQLCHNAARFAEASIAFESEEIEIGNNEAATQLFRIAQESLNNAIKHSGSNKITVSIRIREQLLILEIADDGCGMETGSRSTDAGFGLRIMNHRCQLINGRLEIHSRRGRGTIVRVTWPMDPGNQADWSNEGD